MKTQQKERPTLPGIGYEMMSHVDPVHRKLGGAESQAKMYHTLALEQHQ